MFNTKKKGFGFGLMPGFHKGKKNTVGRGNFDGDRKPNRTDCEPLNFRKQDKREDLAKKHNVSAEIFDLEESDELAEQYAQMFGY